MAKSLDVYGHFIRAQIETGNVIPVLCERLGKNFIERYHDSKNPFARIFLLYNGILLLHNPDKLDVLLTELDGRHDSQLDI